MKDNATALIGALRADLRALRRERDQLQNEVEALTEANRRLRRELRASGAGGHADTEVSNGSRPSVTDDDWHRFLDDRPA